MIRLQERRIERNKRFFKNQRVSVVRKGEPFRGPFRPRPVTKAFSRRANHQFTLVVLILNSFPSKIINKGGDNGWHIKTIQNLSKLVTVKKNHSVLLTRQSISRRRTDMKILVCLMVMIIFVLATQLETF